MITDKLMKNCVDLQNTVTDLDLNFLLIGICTNGNGVSVRTVNYGVILTNSSSYRQNGYVFN